jgi:hypothetical protein
MDARNFWGAVEESIIYFWGGGGRGFIKLKLIPSTYLVIVLSGLDFEGRV